ncbi:ribosomal protein L1p/L10e family-domain-containing protein [Fomitopsis serialis]|uniref:ribosomal protein L1p/L10e family-domain-containing protein n=1 Tax=Fomitopsis serialis TaxID=139415 RepID=UPI00200875C6|nr:ribosomal protein L1p/L10e family-domain-containing protein [Neoantrodia serialis]KAH9922949.1 ribosomal protein L1p/L10e family-domain-containing protein [Neoantrodia serialis]
MAKDELIGDHVSSNQCKLAVDALLSHAVRIQEKKAQTELLPGRSKTPIAHPIVDPRVSSVCLITKDPQREYKDLLESHGIRFISRVVGIEKLKGKFKPFEARRMLLKENDLFLADERVVPLLPGLLGKKFFEAKKALTRTFVRKRTTVSVKIGTVSQSPAKVLDNLKMALPAIVKRIKGEWDNVQSFHIKTNSSASLPIWSCDLGTGDGARWDGLVADAGSDDESEAEESEEESEVGDVESVPAKTKAGADAPTPVSKTKTKKGEAEPMDVDEQIPSSKEHSKGKKRAAEDVNDTPQKKAKADRAPSSATKAGPKSTTDVSAAISPAGTPASIDVPTQGKKRRSSVSLAEAPAPAQILSALPSVSTKEAQPAADADTTAPTKKRRKRKVVDAEAATSETPTFAAPTTAPVTEARAASPGPALAQLPEDAAAAGPTRKRKRNKGAAAEASKDTDVVATAPMTAHLESTTPAQPTANEGENTTPSRHRKRRHAKAAAGDAAASEDTAGASTDAVVSATSSQPAPASAENSEGATKRKRKRVKAASGAAEVQAVQSSETAAAPPATPAARGEDTGSAGVPPEPVSPATPSITKRKRRRASAVDFFQDGETTATHVVSTITSKKGKPVEATPLKSALEQVANEASSVSPEKANAANGDTEVAASPLSTKRPRKRKSKAALSAAPESTDAPAPSSARAAAPSAAPVEAAEANVDVAEPKKVKRKHKKAAAAAEDVAHAEVTDSVAVASPTTGELKKKRGAAGGEKKKDKALGAAPAAKSAKDAVVGKKHL